MIDGKGADLVAALGERGEDVSARIVGIGERATYDGEADGQPRRSFDPAHGRTHCRVNGGAADPVRALSALTGQLRAEVANSSEALRSVAAEATHRSSEAIDALLKRLTEHVDASTAALRAAVIGGAENSVEALAGTGDRRQRIDAGDRQSWSNRRRYRPGDRVGRRPPRRRSERARRAGRGIPTRARRHRVAGRDAGTPFSDYPVGREHAHGAARPAC